jgi:hypothetical protein
MYNGIYFQSTLFRDGRLGTDSLNRVCPSHSSWGQMRGNVVHSNQRFGWYPDVNYPNSVKRSIDSNGYVEDLNSQCTDDLTDFSADAGKGGRVSDASADCPRLTDRADREGLTERAAFL